ncbi:hypothetical protein [Gottfriedia solisilvae]|uniref:Uncharacterized protein n=1 Tax=Gottfriedia solisilvae TaxID=1516104 RepID=A0A8J3EY32_9BACI|nr:hypothetical protein [Gottfriedia solisilvae]GGI12901.1 hypothetical protein GCM10007380_15230 [Gottfriedia solisilvae]
MENVLTYIIKNEHSDKYKLFKEFCILKEKGLRKEAFKSLNTFINDLKKWDANAQKEFACWLFDVFENTEEIHHVLVHPLEENLLKPLLNQWMISTPKDSRPFRWHGLFLNTEYRIKYLKIAIEIGRDKEQNALLQLIELYFYSLWYSFHHISEDFYLGDINEDKSLIVQIEDLISKVDNEQFKKNLNDNLIYYKNLLSDWIDFKKVESEGFVQWCADNGKEYSWTEAYYYEKD